MNERDATLRAALRQLPAPDPSPDVLSRILRSRALGVKPALQTPTRAPWRWVAVAVVAGLLVAGSWALSVSLTEVADSQSEFLRNTWLWRERTPSVSGKVPQPRYDVVTSDMLDLSRMTEGVWTYLSETTTDRVLTRPNGVTRIRVSRATHASAPVWMVLKAIRESRGAYWVNYGDTTYLDASSLRPIRTSAYANRYRTRLRQSFTRDSGYESIDLTYPQQRAIRGAVPLAFPTNVLFVNDWSLDRLSVAFPALPLSRGWRGSLYQVAFISRPDARKVSPLDLRVVGTDRITVPAGTFDCWRVTVEMHVWDVERYTVWVSRNNGWAVKIRTGRADWFVDRVLESYEGLPGN